jgi:hypothetical protein
MSDGNSLALLEQLGLNALSKPGRRAVPLALEYVRDLTADDIERANNGELAPIAEGLGLKAVSTKHHTVAQLLASGTKQIDAAFAVGMTPQHVSNLSRDPQFMELVEYYRAQGEAKYLNVHERLGQLGMATVDELTHRVENKPDTITTRELKEILEASMDRSIAPIKGNGKGGAAPPSAVQVNISFPGQDSASAKTIDLQANDTAQDDEP